MEIIRDYVLINKVEVILKKIYINIGFLYVYL